MIANTISSVKLISVAENQPLAEKCNSFVPVEIWSLWDLEEIICDKVWSPTVFKNNRRHKSNFEKCIFLGIDIDEGASLDETVALIREWELRAIIGTTRSHRKLKNGKIADRFRIIIEMFEYCNDIELLEYNLGLYVKCLGADRSCVDGARLFYKCTDVVYCAPRNDAADWRQIPPEIVEVSTQPRPIEIKNNQIPFWVIKKIREGVPRGGNKRPGRHSACYAIARALTECGFSEVEIVDSIMTGPLAELGRDDVRRQVEWGSAKAKGTKVIARRARESGNRAGQSSQEA